MGIYYLLAIAALTVAFCSQLPLPSVTNLHDATLPESSSPALVTVDWDLNTLPGGNDTDHLIFDTVFSLLQHWPNTRYRNGHNIVPGTIPRGTHLYHGTNSSETPDRPEWLATDPEHSYLFCRPSVKGQGCWHLTFVTTRPLNVLYFDGSSAAKMLGGPMESQDILLWGAVKPEWTSQEEKRINEMCIWGRAVGIDAFVRMALDFEIMMCDFSNGLQPVSKLQLVSPVMKDESSRNPRYVLLRDGPVVAAVETGSLHNHYPGEPRIQLDLSRFISFYDTELAPSLIPSRVGQSRFQHRLANISSHDAQAVRNAITRILHTDREQGSGIDWKGLFRVIMLRYSERLQVIQHHLNSTKDGTGTYTSSQTVRLVLDQLRNMLDPYILHTVVPPSTQTFTNDSWASPVFRHCASTHTDFATSISSELTPSEHVLLRAAQGTNREICRVVVKMWANAVVEGLDPLCQPSFSMTPINRKEEINREVMKVWRRDLDGLIRWLDWSIWIECSPACEFEEMCYLPTWNLFRNRDSQPNRDEEDWRTPHPKCVRRMEPYAIETW